MPVILFPILLLILGLTILVFGGDFLVRGATNIAYKSKVSPLVVGLTIVAFGTSAPELVVSLSSVAENPGICIGNVVGSNICNLSLVLGITALFYPIAVGSGTIKIDWGMTIGSALLLYFFVSADKMLKPFEGFILFLILIIYTYYLIEMSRRDSIANDGKEILDDDIREEYEEALQSNVWKEIGFLVVGIVMLFIGGQMFVDNAVEISKALGVSDEIIGLTVVALGTSFPELITSVIAATKKNTDLAIGNLLGSCIFNVFSILGITSMVKAVTVSSAIIDFDMIVMVGIMLLLLPIMISKKRVSSFEGGVLLFIYIVYTGYKVYSVMYSGMDVALPIDLSIVK